MDTNHLEWLGRQSVDEIRDDQRIDQSHGVSMEIVEDPSREEARRFVMIPQGLNHLCRSSIGSTCVQYDQILHTLNDLGIIGATTEHLPDNESIN